MASSLRTGVYRGSLIFATLKFFKEVVRSVKKTVVVHQFTYLATEAACILGVLGDFHFLDHFTERSTVSGTIFARNADLLGALGLLDEVKQKFIILPTSNFHCI